MIEIDWQLTAIIGGALLFAALIVEMARRDGKKWRNLVSVGPEEPYLNEVEIVAAEPLVEFETVEQIHAYFAKMKETDPLEAGLQMYKAQLKLHGS